MEENTSFANISNDFALMRGFGFGCEMMRPLFGEMQERV
jgi:hypothetical protein